MDAFAMWLGYAVMAACGTAAVSGALIGAVMLLNRASWKLLEPYGGFKTFQQFREWYWAQPGRQPEPTLREKLRAWRERTGLFMDGRDGGM